MQTQSVYTLDLWQYPEMADKHSLFAGAFPVKFTMSDYFDIGHPEFFFDYVLPIGFPFSVGLFVNPLGSGAHSYGIRIGYHINFNDDKLDLYLAYTTCLIFEGENIWLEYGGRIGIRRMFGSYFCINIETGFKLQFVYIGVAIKLN